MTSSGQGLFLSWLKNKHIQGQEFQFGNKKFFAGEVTVKWVEAYQTGLPMCIGGAIFGPIRLKPKYVIKIMDLMICF